MRIKNTASGKCTYRIIEQSLLSFQVCISKGDSHVKGYAYAAV